MVLIIHTAKREARAIADIFYYMGVVSYAATPIEALGEISGIYRAILIIDPDNLPDIDSFVEKLRSYNSRIPIFAVSDQPNYLDHELFDGTFPDDIYSSRLIEEIVRYQKSRGLPLSACYRMAGIDASCHLENVLVFEKPLSFTKTETMILRYMIAAYPTPRDANDILRYAFKPMRKPEPASIRTHVSVMNKKFRELRSINLFIALPGEGYVISTPELLQDLKRAN